MFNLQIAVISLWVMWTNCQKCRHKSSIHQENLKETCMNLNCACPSTGTVSCLDICKFGSWISSWPVNSSPPSAAYMSVNWVSIGSHNGLAPNRRQAITWTNVDLLSIGPSGTNFSENWIEIQTFSFKKMCLKVSSVKYRPFCLGLNVLKSG